MSCHFRIKKCPTPNTFISRCFSCVSVFEKQKYQLKWDFFVSQKNYFLQMSHVAQNQSATCKIHTLFFFLFKGVLCKRVFVFIVSYDVWCGCYFFCFKSVGDEIITDCALFIFFESVIFSFFQKYSYMQKFYRWSYQGLHILKLKCMKIM